MENKKDILKTIDFLDVIFGVRIDFLKLQFWKKKKNPDDNYRLIILMDKLSP
jgi:hypothetical protein